MRAVDYSNLQRSHRNWGNAEKICMLYLRAGDDIKFPGWKAVPY